LAILNGAGRSAARKTSFPVCLSPSDFQTIVARRVAPFISNTAVDEIEKLQPYAHGNAGRHDALYVLATLDNIDKHRLLIVTVAKFRPIAFCITLPNGDQFRHVITPAEAGEWKPNHVEKLCDPTFLEDSVVTWTSTADDFSASTAPAPPSKVPAVTLQSVSV
jgi:hypothetical protein